MWQKQAQSSPFKESIKVLEADIQHANSLAAAIPKDYGGGVVQMKLSYSHFAPFLLFLIEWLDYSCIDTLPSYLGLLHVLVHKVYVDGIPSMSSKERRATLREFYAVIYPSLKQLEDELIELKDDGNKKNQCCDSLSRARKEDMTDLFYNDLLRDDECGICLETRPKMVLPNCGHSMCITCFRDWNARSQSCPFCRGSLKRVSSGDLWVLTSESDAVDMKTLAKENVRSFYLYIENLPFIVLVPDTHLFLHDYLI